MQPIVGFVRWKSIICISKEISKRKWVRNTSFSKAFDHSFPSPLPSEHAFVPCNPRFRLTHVWRAVARKSQFSIARNYHNRVAWHSYCAHKQCSARRDRTWEDNWDSLDSAWSLAVSSWRGIRGNGESTSASLARSLTTHNSLISNGKWIR